MPLSNEEIQSKIQHHTLELAQANARLSQLVKSPNYDLSTEKGKFEHYIKMSELVHLTVYHFDLRLSYVHDLNVLDAAESM